MSINDFQEIIDDLVEDITSWGKFFIIANEESIYLANKFYEMLERQNIFSNLVVKDLVDVFKKYVCDDDAVLVISPRGSEAQIIDMVKNAKIKNAKVYAICNDSKSDLALLSDEVLIADKTKTFEENFFDFIFDVGEKLLSYVKDDKYEMIYAHEALPLIQDSNPFKRYENTVNNLVGDINSSGKFFIIANEESRELVEVFHMYLGMNDIPVFISIGQIEDDFKEKLVNGDSLLAISKLGSEDYILNFVKFALIKKVKVYAICKDLKTPLSLFASEKIISYGLGQFEDVIIEIFKGVVKIQLGCDEEYNDNWQIPLLLDDSISPPEDSFLSPIGGTIFNINVNVGDIVKRFYVLGVLEYGNIKKNILSDRDGIVEKIMVGPGDSIVMGDPLMIIRNIFSNYGEEYESEHPKMVGKLREDLIPESTISLFDGIVVRINVNVGDKVGKGDILCVIEAMKMESEIYSDKEGIVEEIFVKLDDSVSSGDNLMIIK